MKLTPHTIPDVLALRDSLNEQYAALRTLTLALGNESVGAPRPTMQRLYTAMEQFRHLNKNLAIAASDLVSLEREQQDALGKASPSVELPTHSFRLDVDGETELEDVTEERARETYALFDRNNHKVRLYQRPVTSNDPKRWDAIDWNYDLDTV